MNHHTLRCCGNIPKTHFLFSFFSLFFLFSFTNSAFDLATIPFNDGYSHLFGDGNVVRSSDGNGVQLLLDRYTGNYIIKSYHTHAKYDQLCFVSLRFIFSCMIFFFNWLSFFYIGSGFISSNMYQHGFFSANIKLPSNYSAGICVAFYVSIHKIIIFLNFFNQSLLYMFIPFIFDPFLLEKDCLIFYVVIKKIINIS